MKKLNLADYAAILRHPSWALSYLMIFKLNFWKKKQIKLKDMPFIFNYKSRGAFLKLITRRFVIKDKIENILDIGATIGEDAYRYIEYYSPKNVLMVEASRENFKILKMNMKNLKNVKAVNGYVCSEPNNQISIISNESAAGWRKLTNAEREDAEIEKNLETISLKELLMEFDNRSVCLLKISINGGENELINKNGDVIMRSAKYIAISLFEDMNPGVSQKFYKLASKTHKRVMINEGFELWCQKELDPHIITERYS